MFLVWGSELARLLKSDHSRPKGQFEAEKASKETTKNWTDQSHPKPPEAESGQALGEKALDVAKKASKVEAFLPTLPSHGFCLALVRRRMLVAVRPAILRPSWGHVALAAAHVEISVSSTATRWPETVWEISFRWDGRHDVRCPRWIWEKSVVSSIWLLKAPQDSRIRGQLRYELWKAVSGARPETSWNSCRRRLFVRSNGMERHHPCALYGNKSFRTRALSPTSFLSGSTHAGLPSNSIFSMHLSRPGVWVMIYAY